MFNLVLVISFTVPLLALALEIRRKPPQRLVLSHFWYFTLIWMAAFPLRGWLVLNQERVSQVIITGAMAQPEAPVMAAALSVALTYWLAAYFGFRFFSGARLAVVQSELASTVRVVAVGAVWLAIAIGTAVFLNLSPSDLDGPVYLRSRMGLGLIWMLPELCVPAFIAFLACIAVRPRMLGPRVLAAVLVGAGFVSLWMTMEFSSRRIIAAVLLGIVVVLILRRSRLWPLGGIAVVGSVFGAGLFELVRYIPTTIKKTAMQGEDVWHAVQGTFQSVLVKNQVFFFSTSFEGAEHVARFLDQASRWQLWTGIDHGLSWLFNLGFSFVPRALWQGKPILYGGLEQMARIYPAYVRDGLPITAIPTSFVVDFAYGFGLPFGLILAFFLGRYLRVCEDVLVSRTAHPAAMGFSLITFIFMFNVVRGGTAIGQTLAVFAVIAASMLGVRATIGAVWRFVSDTFGFGSKAGTSNSAPVFFYPHDYLRDRQLDTIRFWPQDKVVNSDLLDGRCGAQVSRKQALAVNRRSWKQVLPLLNLKRRPPAAPADSPVYIWGGLVASGPFIVDLDNPYALTGYNVFAARLYRPVIRWILSSSRCLSIRCLSRACRDGLRDLYGDSVAAKAVVAYPAIMPKVAAPPAASEGRCRFLFVATQFEIKGGAALLNSFRRVVQAFPGATLDLVTHLPQEFAESVSSCPGVTVHDASFTRDQIAERFLTHTDVLVHPTYCDSFGMVILEAMAFGLPVIATRLYAIPEMVEDGISGVLLDPPVSIWDGFHPTPLFPDTAKVRSAARVSDSSVLEDELTEAMLLMARDPVRRRAAGQAGLQRAETWFHAWAPA